jgi:hypothetical protein
MKHDHSFKSVIESHCIFGFYGISFLQFGTRDWDMSVVYTTELFNLKRIFSYSYRLCEIKK